jgi:DNA invertase Pin-like site-specific DNA recombinase
MMFECAGAHRLHASGRIEASYLYAKRFRITTADAQQTDVNSIDARTDSRGRIGKRQARSASLGAISEFERERIRERVMAGLQRAERKDGSSGGRR